MEKNDKYRDAPYTNLKSFTAKIEGSAKHHGYSGPLGSVQYGLRFLKNFYLNILANFVPYYGIRIALHRFRGVSIGKNVFIGYNVTIDNTYPELVTIEEGVAISGNNLILTHSKPLEYHKKELKSYVAPVVIKKNAWITVGVTILPGVTIGEGSIIAAGSVVTDDIADNCLAAGNPAKMIKMFEDKN